MAVKSHGLLLASFSASLLQQQQEIVLPVTIRGISTVAKGHKFISWMNWKTEPLLQAKLKLKHTLVTWLVNHPSGFLFWLPGGEKQLRLHMHPHTQVLQHLPLHRQKPHKYNCTNTKPCSEVPPPGTSKPPSPFPDAPWLLLGRAGDVKTKRAPPAQEGQPAPWGCTPLLCFCCRMRRSHPGWCRTRAAGTGTALHAQLPAASMLPASSTAKPCASLPRPDK